MLSCRMLHESSRLPTKALGAGKHATEAGMEAAVVGCAIDLRADDVISSPSRGLIADFLLRLPAGIAPRRANSSANGCAAVWSTRTNGEGETSAPSRCTQFRSSLAIAKKMRQNSTGSGNVVVAFAEFPPRKHWAEALGVAQINSLPMIFVQQSEAAEGVRTASPRAREEKRDHGVPRIPVDKSDAVALYRVAHEAIRHARQNGGPTLIECRRYRLEGKPRTETSDWEDGVDDPIRKMESYLVRKGLFNDGWKRRLMKELSQQFAQSTREAEPEGAAPSAELDCRHLHAQEQIDPMARIR